MEPILISSWSPVVRHRPFRLRRHVAASVLTTTRSALLLACLAGTAVAATDTTPPSPSVAGQSYAIPALPLGQALAMFGKRANIQITYDPALIAGKTSHPVSGTLTSSAALQQLLSSTGLSYRPAGQGTIVIQNTPSASNIMLGPVRVGGKVMEGTDPQSAYGPGIGFVATRSASATRTDTPLLETPKSIYVVTRTQMDDLQPQSIAEALRYTPGVVNSPGNVLSSSPSSDTFQPVHQRGFESYTFVDGLLNGTSVTDPFFLDRIEALSGPSSVMYGQSTPGGLINMTLKRPTESARHEVNVGFGNYGRYQGQIDFSGPLNSRRNLLYRVVAMGNTQGSQVDYQHYKRIATQGDLEWKIDDRTSITLIGQFAYSPETISGVYVPAYGSALKSSLGRIPVSRYYGDPAFNDNWDREYLGELILHHEFTKNLQFNSTVRYDGQSDNHCSLQLDDADIAQNLITRYAACDSDNNGRSVQMTSNINYKVLTGPVRHNLLVGVDYRDQAEDGRSAYLFSNVPSISITNPKYHQYTMNDFMTDTQGKATHYNYQYSQYAIYFQDQIKWRQVFLTLAGRQD